MKIFIIALWHPKRNVTPVSALKYHQGVWSHSTQTSIYEMNQITVKNINGPYFGQGRWSLSTGNLLMLLAGSKYLWVLCQWTWTNCWDPPWGPISLHTDLLAFGWQLVIILNQSHMGIAGFRQHESCMCTQFTSLISKSIAKIMCEKLRMSEKLANQASKKK